MADNQPEQTKGPEIEIIERLGKMSREEIIAEFFNEEKKRCADSTDEELAIRMKGIRLMQIVLRAREHAIDSEDRDRSAKRTKEQKEKRAELDRKWSPEPVERHPAKKAETLHERIAREKDEAEKKFEADAKKLSLAMNCTMDEAKEMLRSRGKK